MTNSVVVSDRLTLELQGRRYQRQRQAWIDVDNHMVASVGVSIELDRLARQDPVFWGECLTQDAKENPRNKGKIVRIVVTPGDPNRAVMPAQSSSAKKRHRIVSRHGIDCHFSNRRNLVVKCDIEAGWRETLTSWRFGASDFVELADSWSLRSSVTIVEDTSVHWWRRNDAEPESVRSARVATDLNSMCPCFRAHNIENKFSRRTLDGSFCTFTVALLDDEMELNPALPWSEQGRIWQFVLAESGMYESPIRLSDSEACTSRPFRIELRGTLRPPRSPEAKAIYEYDTPMPSAGLPSLGKRR